MNDYNKKIIDEISSELNISKNKVEQVTKHFFNWQREKFIECENTEYVWTGFGKFKLMENKYNKFVENNNKLNDKENNNNK